MNLIKELDRQIKEAKRAASYALTLDEKLDCIRQVKSLEKQRLEIRNQEILRTFETENPTLGA